MNALGVQIRLVCLALLMVDAMGQSNSTVPPARVCSKAETNAVINAAKPASVVEGLMISSPACGACSAPCELMFGYDRILCHHACLIQSENRCETDTLARLGPLIQRANLDDRDSWTSILELAEADCVYCILETIEFVCGERCVIEHLHFFSDFPIIARPCVPELARILALAQSNATRRAIDSAATFGMLNKHVQDIFTPTSLRRHGSVVYRGIGKGLWLYACESADTWAISGTQDSAAWDRCEGRAWIDLATSRARLDAVDRASEAGTFFGYEIDLCAQVFGTEQSRLAPLRSTMDGDIERVGFAPDVTAEEVTCTLLWRFGSFTVGGDRAASAVVQLPPHLSAIKLQGDIYVRKGESITIEGMGVSISVGRQQIRVAAGGSLTLFRAMVVDSVGGSAVYSEGEVTATKCTFARNVAKSNVLIRSNEPLVPPGSIANPPIRGAWLGSYAAAVLIANSKAKLVSRGSIFDRNIAYRGSVTSWGGAIGARGGYVAIEDGSVVSNNIAEGGRSCATGGAMFVIFAKLTISDSNFTGNEVRQLPLYGPAKEEGIISQAGALFILVTMTNISSSTFEGNIARGGKEGPKGGAIIVHRGMSTTIWQSAFRRNRALDGTRMTRGGALGLEPGSITSLDTTAFEGNVAKGDNECYGGGIYGEGKLTMGAGVSFHSNLVESLKPSKAVGGAIVSKGEVSSLIATNAKFVSNMVRMPRCL